MRSIASRALLLASTAWLACASLAAAQAPAEGPSPAPPPPVDAQVAANPAPEVQAEYRAVADAAIAEFDAARFAEARALFLRAHELWPSARTLRTLGMTAFELRLYPNALAELQAALDDPRRPLADTERAQVQGLLEQTRAFVGHYRVRVVPEESELSVDGTPFERVAFVGLVLALGEHQLIARAPGHQELRRTLVVQGREEQELVLSLQPLPSPPQNAGTVADARPEVVAVAHPASAPVDRPSADREPDHTPAIVAFVVAGAGIAVGSVSGLIALGKQDEPHEGGFLAADIATGAFVTAGVAAVVGTVLLLTAAPSSAQPSAATHAPSFQARIGLGTVDLHGSF